MALDAERILNVTNQQKLDDIAWGVRYMGTTIPRFDQDGNPAGETSPNIEAAWNAANFARLNGKLDAVLNVVSQLATGQGVTIDYAKVEEAAQSGTTKALHENTVKVDVTVQGQPNG
jgi:hypothetical protein